MSGIDLIEHITRFCKEGILVENNLKQARQKLGLTQKQLARIAKTPLKTYQKWEQGVIAPPGSMRVLIDLLLKYRSAVKWLQSR